MFLHRKELIASWVSCMTDILNIMTLNVILVQINYDVECYFGLYQSLPTALCCVIFDVHS